MFLFCLMSTLQSETSARNSSHIDESLLYRIAQEDPDAFETLYYATSGTIYGYILSILKNPQDAEDIMQDTYLKIRSAAHLYRGGGKPMAWIFTIAKNLSLMRLRAGARTASLPLEELELAGWEDHTVKQDDRIVLETALRILNEEERQIVILHAVSGMRHREIAENLQLPLGSVLSRYARALAKLKKELKKGGFFNEQQKKD